MSKKNLKILFLGKNNDHCTAKALQFCEMNFSSLTFKLGKFGDGKLPPEILNWSGDYIISYLAPWIIPESLLKKANIAALNFHPATPEYPGIGCNNFALYDMALDYGSTCHHMLPEVDAGDIVAVKRFRVFESDTVASILDRTYAHQLTLFYEIGSLIIQGKELPHSREKWAKKAYTRKEFDDLCKIDVSMSKEEVRRRIRATTYLNWKPTVNVKGFVFEFKSDGLS